MFIGIQVLPSNFVTESNRKCQVKQATSELSSTDEWQTGREISPRRAKGREENSSAVHGSTREIVEQEAAAEAMQKTEAEVTAEAKPEGAAEKRR